MASGEGAGRVSEVMLAAAVGAVVCGYRDQYWQSASTRKARRLTVAVTRKKGRKEERQSYSSPDVLSGTALPRSRPGKHKAQAFWKMLRLLSASKNVTSRLHFACKRCAKSMATDLAGLLCAASARLFCACLVETGENCQSIPKPLTLPRLKQMRWQRGGGERDPAKKGSLWPLKGSQGSFRIRNAGDEAMNTPSVHAKVCPSNGAVRYLRVSIFALCQ
jgi:hypothetical protein